ncbi:protein unc-13 homolog D isoform X2 [Octopus sinensis]|uniref:Protein unc-13 homolog D isoform X2 n=1 Tax=Octopus sinensis TaxID=2607531 RepID=A0A7E6EXG5_9MOLL|nr:protein unc-13 homolog D isoform X2 [Octopus sinensis]
MITNNEKRISEEKVRNEKVYCKLLNSLIHPLGASDTIFGLRPGDLTDYLRTTFSITQEDHELFIKDELKKKPTNLLLNVMISEATIDVPRKNFRIKVPLDSLCAVRLVNATKTKASPKTSPVSSPKSSPKMRRQKAEQDFRGQPQIVKSTSGLKWNEKFELEVTNILTEELHVNVYQQTSSSNLEVFAKQPLEKSLNFKSIFSLSRQNDSGKGLENLGAAIIPLKEILHIGEEKWYDLNISGRRLTKSLKTIGKIFMKLSISVKQDTDNIENYLKATHLLFNRAVKMQTSAANRINNLLSQHSQRILDIYATSHQISKLSQAIIQLTVLLDLTDKKTSVTVTDIALKKAIESVQMTWVTMKPPVGQITEEVANKMPLTDTEISMFRKAATEYIKSMMWNVRNDCVFFPLEDNSFKDLKCKLGVLASVLKLDLWEEKFFIKEELSRLILRKIKTDTSKWAEINLKLIESKIEKDNVVPESENLCELLNKVIGHCTPVGTITCFLKTFGIDYYSHVSLTIDSHISKKAKQLMLEMDKYQKKYYRISANITTSSKVSLRLYITLRKLCNIMKGNFSQREQFLLVIANYQTWFLESLIHWLMTFKVECQSRMSRALEMDKDIVLVTYMLKFSNSSVDVLSCFASIAQEWREIDYNNADVAMMAITKITDLICDSVKFYAEKIHTILRNNRYYDEQVHHFDVNDQLCITLNNIQHVSSYLDCLKHDLEWEKTAAAMSELHDSEEIGEKCLNTLNRLIDNCKEEIAMKSELLVQEVVGRMSRDIRRKMDLLTRKDWKKSSSSDPLKQYLQRNMATLQQCLHESVYSLMVQELWQTSIKIMEQQMMVGQLPDYYQILYRHLRTLRIFFLSHREQLNVHCDVSRHIEERLTLNSETTQELMLQYLSKLCQDLKTPEEDYGQVALKAGYISETHGYVTIYVKVINAKDLPGLDTTGFSDPYVVITLQPRMLFQNLRSQKTKIITRTLNPVFNSSFQFHNVLSELLKKQGAAVQILVYDYDKLKRDDFVGEAVIPLSSIPQLNGNALAFERTPGIILPLKRPSMTEGPLKVLQERSQKDSDAKEFLNERQNLFNNQRKRTDGNKNYNALKFLLEY